jgi:isoleucyl-tRNA synthetase
LNTLIKEVQRHYENYDPTKAGRAIQNFVMDNLSNWFVRLSRKRFWMGEYNNDKISAFQTLYQCLETVTQLSAPIAPFMMDKMFKDLTNVSERNSDDSVHLATFPVANENFIDKELEERMNLAQRISSMVLGLRRKVNIKVRQPLNLIKVPVLDKNQERMIRDVEEIILTEINVKNMDLTIGEDETIVKQIKPNFKALGPKYGKMMKQIAAAVNQMDQNAIGTFEVEGKIVISVDGQDIELLDTDVEISTKDIPGWLMASDGKITVALDINISEELKQEGIAREFINRIQNFRKESGLDVTDKIVLNIQKHDQINTAVDNYKDYIGGQTLAVSVNLVEKVEQKQAKHVEFDNNIETYIEINKAN